MDSEDPIHHFFPDQEDVDLYEVLSVPRDASSDVIKKAYRRIALISHPDKHASSSESEKAAASTKFQQIGFAYAVLSDDARRKRYDTSGSTDEGLSLDAGEDGWEAYFEQLFDRVSRGRLDEMKKDYQGSSEEIDDLTAAYIQTNGDIEGILAEIPHSTHEDEPRFIGIISGLISKGQIQALPQWERSIKDEKAKSARRKQGEKEAKEAEELAKELGVWNEFFGDGKPSTKKAGKGKGKGKASQKTEDEEDVSALQALILKKKERSTDSFFDGLAAKYAEPKGRKRGREPEQDIDEEEFQRIQKNLGKKKSPSRKETKARRAKV